MKASLGCRESDGRVVNGPFGNNASTVPMLYDLQKWNLSTVDCRKYGGSIICDRDIIKWRNWEENQNSFFLDYRFVWDRILSNWAQQWEAFWSSGMQLRKSEYFQSMISCADTHRHVVDVLSQHKACWYAISICLSHQRMISGKDRIQWYTVSWTNDHDPCTNMICWLYCRQMSFPSYRYVGKMLP